MFVIQKNEHLLKTLNKFRIWWTHFKYLNFDAHFLNTDEQKFNAMNIFLWAFFNNDEHYLVFDEQILNPMNIFWTWWTKFVFYNIFSEK